MVSFFEGDRFLGNEARSLATRTPSTTVLFPNILLGREYGDQLVEARRGTRYLYDLSKDEQRGTYKVHVSPNVTLSPEELSGMILRYAKSLAKESAGEEVRDCAITVPPYYTPAQRQALLDAARLAGLAPIALINEGTAAAVNYLSKLPLEKLPRYLVLYDMGAQDTSATVFEVKQVNETRGKFSKKSVTVGVLETLAVAADAALGGADFDEALAQRFAAVVKQERPTLDVHASGARAWSRLVKEANRVKEVLSANVEFTARVEGLAEGYDFKYVVTRAEFEALIEPLLARVAAPAVDALRRANVAIADVELFELVGGGWRVPAVQKRLQSALGRTVLDQHINSDEGAVFGAAYYGASLTPGFRVKDFKIKDAIVQPIDVAVDAQPPLSADVAPSSGGGGGGGDDEDEVVHKHAPLWKDGSRLKSKKTLTFHTTRNLTFALAFADDAALQPGQRRALASYNVSGVPNRVTHPNMTSTPKVAASFMLDASGVVKLVRAEAQFDEIVLVMPKPAKTRASATASAKPKSESPPKKTADDDADADDEHDDEHDDDRAAESSDEKADEKPDDDDAAESENATAKAPMGRVTPVDAGGALIAQSARSGVEDWLGRALDVYEPVLYASSLDNVDNELSYFFAIRISNSTPVADAELRAVRRAQQQLAQLNDSSSAAHNETATANAAQAKATWVAAATLDKNEYVHVRLLYDPAGSREKTPTIGTADEDGIAEVDEKPQLKVSVRGLLSNKTALDALEYFDENIVAKPKPVKRTSSVALKVVVTEFGVHSMTPELSVNYSAQLARLDNLDALKRENADKKNAIEAYCYAMKDKLSDEAFETATTESERDAFRAAINDASDWLYGAGAKASTKEYVDKLASLTKLGDPIETRIRDATEAPALAASMREMSEGARAVLEKLPETHDVTKEEAKGALEMLRKAEQWLAETEAKQATLKPYEKPALSVAGINEQFGKFEKRFKALSTRGKKRPPKPAPKPKAKSSAEKSDEKTTTTDDEN